MYGALLFFIRQLQSNFIISSVKQIKKDNNLKSILQRRKNTTCIAFIIKIIQEIFLIFKNKNNFRIDSVIKNNLNTKFEFELFTYSGID